jgi:short-subunit dehydrogenase
VAGHSLYPGAKSLMLTFSQALDAEYRSKGLKVTAVCPGFTKTEFAAANGTGAVMDEAPRRLFQTPDQVVAAALKANDRGRSWSCPAGTTPWPRCCTTCCGPALMKGWSGRS